MIKTQHTSPQSNSSARHMRTYKSCNHDQLPDLPNFKPRTQRINMEKTKRHMKPAEFASLLCEKLEKLKLDNDEEARRLISENQINIQEQRLATPYNHHAPAANLPLPAYYPRDDYMDSDTQSWIMPPASDRYSVAGASSHSGSGANMENQKNKNIKEKAKELRNAVHHSLRNGLGECECHSCEVKRKEKSSFHSSSSCGKDNHSSEYCRKSMLHGHQICCCQSKDSHCSNSNQSHPLYRKNNSEHSSHRTGDYLHENINEDFVPPIDNTKIIAWMERNERYKHDPAYPDPMPSPAVRRKKQQKEYERNTVAHAVQPIAQDLSMPLLPPPDTGNVLEEVKRVLEEPEQRLSPVKKISSRTHHNQHQQPVQNNYYYTDQYSAYNETTYDPSGSITSANWSDTPSYNPSQISTVPSSASRLWNPEGYYDSSSDVRLEHKSGARSHSTGRHSHNYSNRSEHRSSHVRSDHVRSDHVRSDHVRSDHVRSEHVKSDHVRSEHVKSDHVRSEHVKSDHVRSDHVKSDHHSNDMRSSKTGRSHGSDSNKGNMTTITYYFGVDPIPFRISVPSSDVTLGKFKAETKKGNFRFFFKTISQDDGETVYEEVRHDHEVLPKFKDKIIGKVEKIE